jgi:hypothetical protein
MGPSIGQNCPFICLFDDVRDKIGWNGLEGKKRKVSWHTGLLQLFSAREEVAIFLNGTQGKASVKLGFPVRLENFGDI